MQCARGHWMSEVRIALLIAYYIVKINKHNGIISLKQQTSFTLKLDNYSHMNFFQQFLTLNWLSPLSIFAWFIFRTWAPSLFRTIFKAEHTNTTSSRRSYVQSKNNNVVLKRWITSTYETILLDLVEPLNSPLPSNELY